MIVKLDSVYDDPYLHRMRFSCDYGETGEQDRDGNKIHRWNFKNYIGYPLAEDGFGCGEGQTTDADKAQREWEKLYQSFRGSSM